MAELSKNWRTPEWKEEKAKLFEERGATCEWCGNKSGDVVDVTFWNKRKKKLESKQVKITIAPHHRDKGKSGLAAYKKLSGSIFNQWKKKHPSEYDNLVAEARVNLPEKVEKKDLVDAAKYRWTQENASLIKAEYQRQKEQQMAEYMSLNRETTLVLCNRCHFAREKGLVLCQDCKTNYHAPKYPRCYQCSQKKK